MAYTPYPVSWIPVGGISGGDGMDEAAVDAALIGDTPVDAAWVGDAQV